MSFFFSRVNYQVVGILLYGVAIRLVSINQPFVDSWSHRQSDVAMIAENFYRNGFNIFYPEINWSGNSGYVGTEFPLVSFLAGLLYPVLGVEEWVGRSISVAFYTLSVPFLYLIVKTISSAQAGVFAVLIYTLAPLSIFSSRSFMPDMPTLSLSIIAIYLFMKWLERGNLSLFLWVSLVTSLAILVKAPSMIIGVPLLYLAWEKYGLSFLRRRDLWIFAAFSLIPTLGWYWHAYHASTAEFVMGSGGTHMFGEGSVGFVSFERYIKILERILTWQLTPPVAAAMICGIFLPSRSRNGQVFHWWLVAVILWIVFAGKGNSSHPWYQLPIVPVAAAFGATALNLMFEAIRKRGGKLASLGVSIVLAVMLSYFALVYTGDLYQPWAAPYMEAGKEVDRTAPSDALVVVGVEYRPTPFYYSRRKGWYFWNPIDSNQAIDRLEEFRARGATYLILSSYEFWWLDYYKDCFEYLDSKYRRVAHTENYVIFDLSMASAQ